MEICFLWIVTAAASVINTVTGFGYGILTVALHPFVMPAMTAVTVSGMISVVLSGSIARLEFHNICWKQLFISLPMILIACYLSIYFGGTLSENVIRRILGCVLFVLSLYFLFFNNKVKIRPTVLNGCLMGFLGGALQGLFGMGGPPMALYYLAVSGSKEAYMATLQMYFVLLNLAVNLMRFQRGMITEKCWKYFGILLVPMFLGIWLGSRIFCRLEEEKLRKGSYLCMAFCGIYFLTAG